MAKPRFAGGHASCKEPELQGRRNKDCGGQRVKRVRVHGNGQAAGEDKGGRDARMRTAER